MKNAFRRGNKRARANVHTYSTLLAALARRRLPEDAARASMILNELFADYESGNEDAKPNTTIMTLVADIWAKSGHPEAADRAEAILNRMIEMYETENDENVKPNAMSFLATINALAKSRIFGKARRARMVLDKMVDMYESGRSDVKPNTFVFSSLLNACAFAIGESGEKTEAFQIATQSFKQMCSQGYGKPNHVTYNSFVAACANLLPATDARAASIGAIFKRCCKDGQLDERLLSRLRSALSMEQFRDLFESIGNAVDDEGSLDVEKLPLNWSRNVKDDKPRRRKP